MSTRIRLVVSSVGMTDLTRRPKQPGMRLDLYALTILPGVVLAVHLAMTVIGALVMWAA